MQSRIRHRCANVLELKVVADDIVRVLFPTRCCLKLNDE